MKLRIQARFWDLAAVSRDIHTECADVWSVIPAIHVHDGETLATHTKEEKQRAYKSQKRKLLLANFIME